MRSIRPNPDFFARIEFPRNSGALVVARDIRIWRTNSANEDISRITTSGAFTLFADAAGVVWAQMELYADPDGNPIFDEEPYIDNNQIVTKVFNVHITEIRSATSFTRGFKAAYEQMSLEPPKGAIKDQPAKKEEDHEAKSLA